MDRSASAVTPPGPPHDGLPTWRGLAVLGAGVAAVHLIVLWAAPTRLGARFDRDANETRAFSTRSIAAPAPQTAPALSPAPPPRTPRKKPAAARPASPIFEEKSVVAPVLSAPPAIDSIAQAAPQDVSDAWDSSAVPASAPQAATAPSAAASAAQALALPAGPATTRVTAVELPPSALLEYSMTGASKGLNYQAKGELLWRNGGDHYDASMKVSAMFLGARSMTSSGQITQMGLAPSRFADKFRSEQAAHFLPAQGKITFSANTPDAPWLEGAQDRVSVFLQLGGILAAKPADFPAGSEITLYTIGPREADTWTFVVETGEEMTVLDRPMPTVKVIRKPRREYDQKVEIWYAPLLGYLPVRNRITQQNGDFIEQQLSGANRP